MPNDNAVCHLATRGKRYEVRVYEETHGNFVIRSFTRGALSSGSYGLSREAAASRLKSLVGNARDTDGINYRMVSRDPAYPEFGDAT
jgi:hypothetical protein